MTTSLSAAAFAAIEAALPKGSKGDARSDGKGGYLVTLDRYVLNGLRAIRRPGESYSDVILRLAASGKRQAARRLVALGVSFQEVVHSV